MASEFCNISSNSETQSILNSLPPLPSLEQLAQIIIQKSNQLKILYLGKIEGLTRSFAEGACPSPAQIQKIINTRNNIVESLNSTFTFIDRFSNSISGLSGLVSVLVGVIKAISSVKKGIVIAGSAVPFPIPALVNSVVEGIQDTIEGIKFEADGAQKIIPIANGLISVATTIQVFANVIRNLICQIEALDVQLVGCSPELEEITNSPILSEEEKRNRIQQILIPISSEIVGFIEQTTLEEERSVGNSTYRGFIFEIEKVPFSPTVNRSRANALNSNGIVLLSTELSFTLDPNVLIEELKLVIDRDNLRAD